MCVSWHKELLRTTNIIFLLQIKLPDIQYTRDLHMEGQKRNVAQLTA